MHDPLIGIDLGTTNSALAWSEPRGAIRVFDVVQLVSAGETASRSTLPSFLYLTDAAQREGGSVRLPWNPAPETVAGVFAREEGALIPSRLISSTKSWLSNSRVDRTAALLPWGADGVAKLSPVDASARVLAHLRDAWNHAHAGSSGTFRLEQQDIVLTVPASFDEEARELTVHAARDAGFVKLTLLEEPLAALYAWLAAHRRALSATFGTESLVLVCDVGGGTTDFSLIRARVDEGLGELVFERIAIGEHLLLGGDNLDLALAVLVEQKLGEAAKLTLVQRQTLRRKCSAAKEQLLSPGGPEQVAITILGAGRGVVGGGMSTTMTRDDVIRTLTEGFLPITAAADLPARDRRPGLRELGLPYETEPAITRHLAAFLTRAAGTGAAGSMARPDAVLFNGGFFAPAAARERVLEALTAWFGEPPRVLENERPEAAVAVGAAFYARLRRDPVASKRLIIRAGSARSYYVGLAATAAGSAEDADVRTAVCVMPKGTEEGTAIELEREFTVVSNQPSAFTLYSSTSRSDPAGTVVTFSELDDVMRHSPLVTALRYGKRSRRVPLRVRLRVVFTETGTLELWCGSTASEHRWRLAFGLRALESDPLDDQDLPEEHVQTNEVLIADEAMTRAAGLVRNVFGPGSGATPDTLTSEIEAALGHAKQAWPLTAIRQLADVLLEAAEGRKKSPAHESRWLNLTGFCVRPGFGSATDAFRIAELRKVYMTGLAFPRDVQNQVEWLVLWQRVGAGFNAGQQRELAQRIAGTVGLGQRKKPRLNPQLERESWRLLASLERLDAGQRIRIGDELIERVRREPRAASWLWSIGRLGARSPLYGPLNTVVPAAAAERWIDRLLSLKEITADAADAIAQIGARTGDPACDVSPEIVERAVARLAASHSAAVEQLQHVRPAAWRDAARVFGESLPEGLRLE
jgi:molecular chaperone DnaK (HSP70)